VDGGKGVSIRSRCLCACGPIGAWVGGGVCAEAEKGNRVGLDRAVGEAGEGKGKGVMSKSRLCLHVGRSVAGGGGACPAAAEADLRNRA